MQLRVKQSVKTHCKSIWNVGNARYSLLLPVVGTSNKTKWNRTHDATAYNYATNTIDSLYRYLSSRLYKEDANETQRNIKIFLVVLTLQCTCINFIINALCLPTDRNYHNRCNLKNQIHFMSQLSCFIIDILKKKNGVYLLKKT